jgi:GNAT superfamily N-acetyltransferase
VRTEPKHTAVPFDVQPRRGRFAELTAPNSLEARLEALGFREKVAFRDAMAGLGAWCVQIDGRVTLDLSGHSLAPAPHALRRAFDEGELDEHLLHGVPRAEYPRKSRPLDAGELIKLGNALAGRFACVQHAEAEAKSITLTLESSGAARQLRQGCELLGLRLEQNEAVIRLNTSYAGRLRTIELAFDVIRRVLKFQEVGRDVTVEAAPKAQLLKSRIRVRTSSADEVDALLPKLMALEARIFEPARRDTPKKLRIAFDEADGIASVAEAQQDGEWELVGFSLAIPLEMVDADGPDQDVFRSERNTVYAVSTTLDPTMHGRGLGLGLKQEVIRAAQEMTKSDGTPRYRFMSGRNRTGATGAMQRVNQRLGAYTVASYAGQYGGDGEAMYYRMPVGLIARLPKGDVSGVSKSWLKALEEGRYSGAFLRPQAMSAGMLPETVEALEYFARLVGKRSSVAVFGSVKSALEHVGESPLCVLGDVETDARRASGFDDIRDDEVLLWQASTSVVIVFRAGSVLGDADEFEVLRAWHMSRDLRS